MLYLSKNPQYLVFQTNSDVQVKKHLKYEEV